MAKYGVLFVHLQYPQTYVTSVQADSMGEAIIRAWDWVEVTFEGAEIFAQGLQLQEIYEVEAIGEASNG